MVPGEMTSVEDESTVTLPFRTTVPLQVVLVEMVESDADNGVIEFFDKTSSIKTQSPKPKQKFKDRVLPDVMYLDGFEIYPDELYQVRDDLYIDTNNILFEFNDTTKKLREIGEWDSLKETPILNK